MKHAIAEDGALGREEAGGHAARARSLSQGHNEENLGRDYKNDILNRALYGDNLRNHAPEHPHESVSQT